MRPTRIPLAFALTLALALPAGALAGSAIDQYVESIPGAGADKPSKNVGGNGGGGKGSGSGSKGSGTTIAPSQLEPLEAVGADGVAAAELAQATAPSAREGVRFARALLAASVEPGESLLARYGSRREAFNELYRLLLDEGIPAPIARTAAREFVDEYWRAEVPAASLDQDQEGDSAVSAVLSAFTGGGSGGMGAALPIVLIGALVAALAIVARSRSAAGR